MEGFWVTTGHETIRPARSTKTKSIAFKGLERWQSGRSRRTRNAEYGQPYRGFESLPLRHSALCASLANLLDRPSSLGGSAAGILRRVQPLSAAGPISRPRATPGSRDPSQGTTPRSTPNPVDKSHMPPARAPSNTACWFAFSRSHTRSIIGQMLDQSAHGVHTLWGLKAANPKPHS